MLLVLYERLLAHLQRFDVQSSRDEFAGDSVYLELRQEILDIFNDIEGRIDVVIMDMNEEKYAWNTRVAEFVMSIKVEVGFLWSRHQRQHEASVDRYHRFNQSKKDNK